MQKLIKNISVPNDWYAQLKRIGYINSIEKPISFLEKEILDNKKILPPINDIFNAFKCCSFLSTKVVIFGQDPYFQSGLANGLAFSVDKHQKIPASLKNIYKEIENDVGPTKNKDGCLMSWAKQGVLLLNTSLTVELSKPGSHSHIGWNNFICDVIKLINKKRNVVFILWGQHAKTYSKFITNKDHLILCGSHPSPLSAYRGFFGSKHFSKCNSYLRENSLEEIEW
ncbi:MAG: uracil-DNA glycosylase [Gammaproteobacteria bacterium]|nr:uracil-DNA glycosylase [Gammaproteobacteria bacterium]